MASRKTTDTAALQRQIAELQAQLAAAQAKPASQRNRKAAGNGARFDAAVTVTNGHLIGRDFVQIIEQQVVHGDNPEHAKLALASYLHALASDLAGLRLGDIDASPDQTQQTPLQLPDIYVPLNTTYRLHKKSTLAQALASRHAAGRLPGTDSEDRAVPDDEVRQASALEAMATHAHLTLLGDPGSGKSTFGAHVLLAMAQVWQGLKPADQSLGKAWKHGALLPVRVVLRRFAERHARSQGALTAGQLWTFIGEDLHAGGWGDAKAAMKFVQLLARQHGALVLFDGLDECGDASRRARVLAAVNSFIKAEGAKSRFLVTARPYAFPHGAQPSEGIYLLDALDNTQISAFITAWYAALVKRGWQAATPAARRRDDLLAAYGRTDLRPLAANPLLLTLMTTLHSNRGRLPDDRADLYDETINLLLQRWNMDVGADRALLDALALPSLTLAHFRQVLEKVAFEVHEANAGRDGTAEIGEHLLERRFAELVNSKDKAAQVIEFIERRAGLLIGLGAPADDSGAERRFSFPHRTFQEFLAASYLKDRPQFARECRRLAEQDLNHWRVVLPLAARLAKAERGATAAEELIGGEDVAAASAGRRLAAEDWRRAWLAGALLAEIGTQPLALGHATRATLERVRAWLVAGLPLHPREGGATAPWRARMGDVVAALGDPRFDPARWHLPTGPMLGFVRIEADPHFHIGTRSADRQRVKAAIGRDAYDDEINDQLTPVQTFYIAPFPVTEAQWAAFEADSGHQRSAQPSWTPVANHPVTVVDWHDAQAYCGWLQRQLLAADIDATLREGLHRGSLRVQLPSELQWEKAARADRSDAVFPWGDQADDEQANVSSSGIDSTCAVGCFTPTRTGVHDLIGNVWEWCRSPWVEGDYATAALRADADAQEADTGARRLVRGGAFSFTPDFARCAFRDHNRPDVRDGYLGFRVVLCSAPVL